MSYHSIILRRYSQELARDDYSIYAHSDSWQSANILASEATGQKGDILIVCDTAHVSDLPKYAKSLYAIDDHGKATKAPNVHTRLYNSITWLEAWEGSQAKADDLLYVAADLGVDHKLLVSTACACARTALKYVPSEESSLHIAIETAEAWTRYEVTLKEVRKAVSAADASYTATSCTSAAIASSYAASTCYAVFDAGSAALYAALATDNYSATIIELSSLVREYIPLNTVLLAASKK